MDRSISLLIVSIISLASISACQAGPRQPIEGRYVSSSECEGRELHIFENGSYKYYVGVSESNGRWSSQGDGDGIRLYNFDLDGPGADAEVDVFVADVIRSLRGHITVVASDDTGCEFRKQPR